MGEIKGVISNLSAINISKTESNPDLDKNQNEEIRKFAYDKALSQIIRLGTSAKEIQKEHDLHQTKDIETSC